MSTGTDNMKRIDPPLTEEEKWEQEMHSLEELDRWQQVMEERLPVELREGFHTYLSQFSGLVRIPIYSMIEHLEYRSDRLEEFYSLLIKLPRDNMGALLSFMEGFVPYKLVVLLLYIFYRLQDSQILELLFRIPRDDAHYLMQVLRHSKPDQIEIFIELLGRLDFEKFIQVIKLCNEPTAKDCRLCRTRRLHSLEQRMIHNQVPPGIMKVPGTMPLYMGSSKATLTTDGWTADDEKGFTFNEQLEILWYKQPVDLLRICDKCLLDVHQAVSNRGRFEPIYHVDAEQRKLLLRALRNREKEQAEVIWKISKERAYRRAREFALTALEAQRYGLKREADERERIEGERLRQQQLADRAREQKQLVDRSLGSDRKWLRSDDAAGFKQLDTRQLYAAVQGRLDYALPDFTSTGALNLQAPDNRAPKLRQNERSSKLALIDPIGGCTTSSRGLPIDPEGASQIFGTYVPVVVDEDQQLQELRGATMRREEERRKKSAEIEKAERIRKHKELRELRSYIYDKTCELEENAQLRRLEAVRLEQERLLNRQLDRERRREQRYLQYLMKERQHMNYEDYRSYQLRDYSWQCEHEQNEREGMFNEELNQTEVDRFWGLDLFIRRQYEEEGRLRQLYADNVVQLNSILVKTRAVKACAVAKLTTVGTLPEDIAYSWDEDKRRDAVIRKLRAEQVRGSLKVRPFPGYL